MSSFRQIEANRRNAAKSTGPITEEGKQRSRCNAVRHGLTAETVIGALEDAEDYKAFEAAIIADYDAQSAVERELVLRLASLLWRLRRATTMETGLFEIQADHSAWVQAGPPSQTALSRNRLCASSSGLTRSVSKIRHSHDCQRTEAVPSPGSISVEPAADPTADLARCFLRLANLPNYRARPPQPIRSNPLAPSRPDPVCSRCIGSPQTTGKTATFQFRRPARTAGLRGVLTLEAQVHVISTSNAARPVCQGSVACASPRRSYPASNPGRQSTPAKVGVRLQRRESTPARLRRDASGFLPPLHPFDYRTGAHVEPFCCPAPRCAGLDRFHHSLA